MEWCWNTLFKTYFVSQKELLIKILVLPGIQDHRRALHHRIRRSKATQPCCELIWGDSSSGQSLKRSPGNPSPGCCKSRPCVPWWCDPGPWRGDQTSGRKRGNLFQYFCPCALAWCENWKQKKISMIIQIRWNYNNVISLMWELKKIIFSLISKVK